MSQSPFPRVTTAKRDLTETIRSSAMGLVTTVLPAGGQPVSTTSQLGSQTSESPWDFAPTTEKQWSLMLLAGILRH